MGLFGNNYSSNSDSFSASAECERTAKKSRSDMLICVAVIVIFFFINMFNGSKEVTLTITEDTFGVTNLEGEAVTYAFDDVESLDLRTDLGGLCRGDLLSGKEVKTCWSGTYKNSEFGEYELHVNLKLDYYILTYLKDGSVFIFNIESDDATEQLYSQLLLLLNK